MPTTYTNRVLTILLVLWVAVSAVYQRVPGSLFWLFDPTGPVSFQHSLRPGIDMVGGTSLTYEIKQPEGAQPNVDLAEKVATSLKQRVDPQGVRNLIWRPQGATRLEIQMPMTRQSVEGQKLRDAYNAAKDKLDATTLRVPAVVGDLESLSGAAREAKIAEYAQGSKTRLDLLNQMAALSDQIKAARAKKDAEAAAAARLKSEPLQAKLAETNISSSDVDSALDAAGGERKTLVDALKDKAKDFPAQSAALDEYIKARDAYMKVRDSLDDAQDLKRKLKGSGVLSFHILVDPSDPIYNEMAQRLKAEGPRSHPGDVARWFEASRPDEFIGRGGVPYHGKMYVLGYIDPERSMMNGEGLPHWGLTDAHADASSGELQCAFEFDSTGSKLFGELTGRFKPQNGRTYALAIVLDDKIISAPNINSQIFGRGVISGGRGGFSKVELDDLVSKLSAGSLPAQLTDEPISEITVGPQLGSDNLKSGLISCGLGLVVVFFFLVIYYYTSGLVAFCAVLANLVLILGAMAAINATFTLPGVAGVVLSVAIAVDANVLIFERLREEQARGLSLRLALDHSYSRAFSAIFDGQVTTAISSLFLFWFGSEEVRGFGLTLLIGIVTSLFTALFITKTIFGLMVDKLHVKDLSSLPRTFPKWNQLLTPSVNWIKLSWVFLVFSAVFIGGGLACFAVKYHQGQALGIEFSGGTAVQVKLVEPKQNQSGLDRAAVQKLVEDESAKRPDMLADPRVVALGTDNLQYEISTPTTNSGLVQKAVIEALGDRLDISKPSQFTGMNEDFSVAENREVFPIASSQTQIDGVASSLIESHVGGVAIVLNNLNPPLDAKVIRSRILARADQEKADQRPEQVDVETYDNNTRAVIILSDSRYTYDPTNANAINQWRSSLAGPGWQIVKDAINNPPVLTGVTSFNAQVAEEAEWNTVMALFFSILGIMAYIWFRFGNLKFGTGAVVACVHDAAFVVAAIGFSLYLGQFEFFEKAFLIHPFRVDLTLVAAVLTVVGYSLNDTVVIFDRVRENRGKFGVMSKQVINDSINQTFSRTLLTGGTSIGILLIMYLLGGEGIHGFTFVMLLGIIVGTYSSIAVASPLLLLGNKAKQPTTSVPARNTATVS
ncbi:MAG: protein translocase subunit SecD [Tepidisphaeraceae bacterium]